MYIFMFIGWGYAGFSVSQDFKINNVSSQIEDERVTQRIDHKGKKGSHEHVCLPALLTTRGPQSRNLFHSPSSRWWSSSRPRQLIGPRLCKVVVVVCAALTDRQMQKTDHPYSSEYHIILQAHSVFWHGHIAESRNTKCVILINVSMFQILSMYKLFLINWQVMPASCMSECVIRPKQW